MLQAAVADRVLELRRQRAAANSAVMAAIRIKEPLRVRKILVPAAAAALTIIK